MGDEPTAMTPAPSEQSVFAEAILLSTPQARAAYLDSACGTDTTLRQRVEALLRAAENAGDFLEEPPTGLSGDADSTIVLRELSEKPGDRIGRYKLLQQIGEGGCGVVYMAEQLEPVKRRVALKVIKLGMDTKSVIARFEAERQALALMDHPNIAKVLDAGATETGRPYFVMELVRGIKITEYCDQNNLSTDERLKLFTEVCHAIQHAHQKGIIHRDIKPSNILVTQNENEAVPKVIDFGIAKATTDQRLTDKTVFTAFEQFIGTPAYMSPEQAMMTSLDIDTRTDIYALGVLLYELLTGQTPFDANELMAAGLDAMRRTIREQEPPRPSTRLTQQLVAADVRRRNSGEVEPSASSPRRLQDLIHALRGDLDWIVMKALEKDRTRRYETANGLAMDIQRHLHNEPVTARPPSRLYEFQKTVRRHKFGFAAAAGLILVLTLGVLASSWQALRATRAKAAAVAEKQRADREAATATSVTEYLQQMLGSIDPASGRGLDYSVRQLLDDYADNLAKQLPDQPEVEAALRSTIGRAYFRLGQRDKARQHLMRALVLRRGLFGEKHEEYADSLVDYAWTSDQAGEFPGREADLHQAIGIYRARGMEGEPVIRALFTLQTLLLEQSYGGLPGRWDEIEAVSLEALAEGSKQPRLEFADIARIQGGLVHVKLVRSQFDEAQKIARESLAARLRLYGPEHPETAWGHYLLGEALRGQRNFSEAMQAHKQTLALMRKIFSPEQKNIATALSAVIRTLELAGQSQAVTNLFPSGDELNELEASFREVLAKTKPSTLDSDDPVVVAVRGLAGFSEIRLRLNHELAATGQHREAEESRAAAIMLLENLETQFAGNPNLLAQVYGYGAIALMKGGQRQPALDFCRKLLNRVTPKKGGLHNHVAWFLATAENPAQRAPALAVELAQKAVEANPQSTNHRNTLGVARYYAGDWTQAIADLEASVALGKGGNSFDMFFLAMAHWQLGQADEARRLYTHGIQKIGPQPGEDLSRFQLEAEALIKPPSANALQHPGGEKR
ncbi:MAG: serine/threonine protein kinase [Verrucomicrobiae bacterium]|nr:serine/threonine protein kinase [Verrucomicrobiae bacterium]